MGAKSSVFLVFYAAIMMLAQWHTPVAAGRPVRILSEAVGFKRALENTGIVEGEALDDVTRSNAGVVPNRNIDKTKQLYQNETVIFVMPEDDDDRDEQAEADNVRAASDEGEGHQQDPARRSLAAGARVEHGDWPSRVEVTGRLGMGQRDDVQCQSNRYHDPTGARLFEYTHNEKMSNYWIAGVDRAWFSKNDRKGETSKLCGICIRLQDPDTGKQVGPKFMLVDRIYQKPGRSHSSIDIAAAPFKEVFGGHNPKKMFIPVDVGC